MATITEAKNRLSALIDRVRAGETIVITDRGRPVARLEPAVSYASQDARGRLARLERAGIVRPAKVPGPAKEIISREPPRLRKKIDPVKILLEERRAAR